jgi:hypothetical protein
MPNDLCSTNNTPRHSISIKPPLPSDFLTGSSELAMRRRVIPNILKKASQNDLASASSRDSVSHSFEKALARILI